MFLLNSSRSDSILAYQIVVEPQVAPGRRRNRIHLFGGAAPMLYAAGFTGVDMGETGFRLLDFVRGYHRR